MNKGHGFIPDIIQPEDYVLGGFRIPEEVLQEDGNWTNFLPAIEFQKRNGLETMNCTVYGTLNCIETLLKRLFGVEVNKSERYIGVVAETSQNGNAPQRVIEVIRKVAGLIDERLLPFGDTIRSWEEYYSPKPMTLEFFEEGKKWLEKYTLKHEWVFSSGSGENNKIEKLKTALRYSPLGVSVYAWDWGDDGLYAKKADQRDNHWVMLYNYREGEYWEIFDRYDNTFKKLRWGYNFGFAKRYHIKKNILPESKSWWQKVCDFIKNYLNSLMR